MGFQRLKYTNCLFLLSGFLWILSADLNSQESTRTAPAKGQESAKSAEAKNPAEPGTSLSTTKIPAIGKLNLQKLDNYIMESMPEWNVPGMAIAIVKNDTIVFARGYGVKEFGKEGKVDENTVFSIASLTKGFTSTALAMLNDEGLIDWDDHVQMHLPDFRLYDSYVSSEIRIRDLLCHRSGLKTFSGDLIWFGTHYSRAEVIHRARYLKPAHGFRYEYGYSNLMFLTAGEIIPQVSDLSWENFVENKLLQPLGMDRTSFSVALENDGDIFGGPDDGNVAMPHYVDLLSGDVQVLPYLDLDNIAPAMGMNSSVMDLSRWIRFNLNLGEWDGVQLVSRENLWETRKLHTEHSPELHMQRIWPSRHFNGYGLGWDLYDYHGWEIVAHEGGTDGMISRLVMVPDENFGFVILTNSINGLATSLEYFILDQYYQGKSYDWSDIFLGSVTSFMGDVEKEWEYYKASADRTIKPSLKLNKYTGVYEGELYGSVEVRYVRENPKDKKGLVLDFLPSDLLIGDLQEFSKDTFLIRLREIPSLPEGTVKFLLDEDGEVKQLKVDIPNPDFDFTELEFRRISN